MPVDNREPLYGCCQCWEERSFPASMLCDNGCDLWCHDCWIEAADEGDPDWHDLSTFVPTHETELAELRAENERLREVIRCTALGIAEPRIESLWKEVNGYPHQAAEAAGEE